MIAERPPNQAPVTTLTGTVVPAAGAPSTESRRTSIVVASVPASHVYVRHLAPEDGAGPVHRLPDPTPDPARGPTSSSGGPR